MSNQTFRQFLEASEPESYVGLHIEIPLEKEVYILNQLFKEHGFHLFVVGGAVRDFLFHHFHGGEGNYKAKDIDLATDAKPNQIKKVLSDSYAQRYGIREFESGKQFGITTAIVPSDSGVKTYEIATFREDSKTGDGRRPDYVTYSTPGKDAKRRDLTFNALYYDISRKEIRDYNGGEGIEHIKQKMASPVGDPFERFDEDRLRPLRLIGFFSRFNNGGPEDIERTQPRTADALRHFSDMPGVSAERIRQEFLSRLQSAKDPVNYLKIYQHFGFFPRMFPGLKVTKNLDRLRMLERDPEMTRNPRLLVAWLLKDNDPSMVQKVLNEMTYPENNGKGRLFKFTKNVEFLISLKKFGSHAISEFLRSRNNLRPQIGPNAFDPKMIAEHDREIMAWAALVGLDQNLVSKFLQYERQISSDDPRLAQFKGAELGQKMKELEADHFRQVAGH